jgi:uncharacterized protein (UPF0297 family)
MKNILLSIVTIVFFTACFGSNKTKISTPYISNLSNPNEWSFGAGAILDKQEKAIKFSKSGSTWITTDRITSNFLLDVKPNTTYTISFKSKTDNSKLPSLEVYGAFYSKDGELSNSLGTMVSNSTKNIWEENHIYIDTPNNQEITSFQIKVLDLPKKGVDGNIWIKDISFKEGLHTSNNVEKKEFNGSITKVDKLGNITILKDGRFEPFFPIGIYSDHKRADWSIYKNQGFNIDMWADGAGAIKKAKKVGLYSSMQIVQYIMPSDPDWIPQTHDEKIAHLNKRLIEIKDQGLLNNLLFYYIDNEFYHIKKEYTEIADIVINQDKDKNGQRMHPLYMLSGTYGLARKYNKRVDFTGTYVAEDHYDTDRTNAFTILNETQNQKQPAIIAQINRGVGKNFRAILFGAIAKGAKGMAYWRDGGSVGDISKREWWRDLPAITKEIKTMMPLIRSSHKTTWTAMCDEKKFIYGTRFVNNIGYIIISNPAYKDKTAEFKIQDLPYQAKEVLDYFTNDKITNIKNNKFTINIPAHKSKVLKLVN